MSETDLNTDGFYNDDQQTQLKWITLVFSILSMIGQIMIFLTYICMKLESPISAAVDKEKARSVHFFIVAISFYDFIRIIGDLINSDYPYGEHDKCIAQSVLVSFGSMSIFLLIGIISIIMVISVFIQNKADKIINNIISYRTIILIIITIISLCCSLIPINGGWCLDNHIYLKFIYLIPLLFIYFFIIIPSYLMILIFFCKQKSFTVLNNFYRDVHIFPLVLLICFAFGVSRSIYIASERKEPAFWVAVIDSITRSSYGFCNFITYWLAMQYQYKHSSTIYQSPNDGDNDKNDKNNNDNTEIQAIAQDSDGD